MAASCATAGLSGWLAATAARAASPQQRTAASRSASPGRVPAARTVMVSDSGVAGLPPAVVLRQLRQLGLHPRLLWVPTGSQAPGTVISVQPAGRLPVGTAVVVIAASRLPGQGNDGGGGNGGDGHGSDGGQGH